MNSAKAFRSNASSSPTIKLYKALSPRILRQATTSFQEIQLKACGDEEIQPNMELRKNIVKQRIKTPEKKLIYLRSQLWQQKLEDKLSEKRWNQQIFEISQCTFSPVINKSQRKMAKEFRKECSEESNRS